MLEKILDVLLILFVVPIIIISAVIVPFGGILYLLFKLKAKKYEESSNEKY